MFDNLKGMAALSGLLKDLPRIKAKMQEVKESLGDKTVEGEAGGGAVRVRANGLMRIISIQFDHAMLGVLVDPAQEADRAVAQELIVGATKAALTNARTMAQQEMTGAAQQLGLPIPPGAIEGLLG